MKYEQLAKDLIEKVGGRANINSVFHCITRLRFQLKDESLARTNEIKGLHGVITVMQSGGQYQIVIGSEVPDVYKAVVEIGNIQTGGQQAAGKSKNKTGLFNGFIDIISGVFTPILGILSATGMLKGLASLFLSLGWITNTSGTYQLLYAAGDSLFYFFPIFLGYTAIKKFGGTPFLGMAVGASLVYPSLSGLAQGKTLYTLFTGTLIQSSVHITFLGVPVILMQYSSSVIPIILAAYFAAKVEKGFQKVIPAVVKTFLVPFFSLLVVVPVTFIVIGPVSTWASNLIGTATVGIYHLSPIITGILLAGFWQVLVIFGLHWGIVPIAINNIAAFKADPILSMVFAASFAQIGAVLAVIMKAKGTKLKSLGIPAVISGIFGVTEPSIYGITLPLKKPFIMSCIASAIGGGIIGFAGTKVYILGGLGIFGIPNMINPAGGMTAAFWFAMIAIFISFILGFVLTYAVGFQEPVEENMPTIEKKPPALSRQYEILSPAAGDIVELQNVSDPVFAQEIMGKGMAIQPWEGRVVSPVNGTVTTLFKTKHAIGLTDENGVELLIHIGIDTVQLDGKYFTAHVKNGDRIKIGDLLMEFDRKQIEEEGYETVIPVIVTNTADYFDVLGTNRKAVQEQDKLITILI